MLRKTLVLALALTAGCGSSNNDGGGSKGPAALTPEQTVRFQQTKTAIGEATDWQQSRTRAASIDASSVQLPSRKPQVEQEVGANCQFNVVQPRSPEPGADPTAPMNISMGMQVAGPNCPISFAWTTNQNVDRQAQTSKVAFSMKYAAVREIAKLIDVLSYRIDYEETLTNTGLRGSGSGLIESKSQGNIKLELASTGAGNNKAATITKITRFVYPDGLVVELKQTTAYAEGQLPKSQQFINNTVVSEREYNEAMQNIGMNNANQT